MKNLKLLTLSLAGLLIFACSSPLEDAKKDISSKEESLFSDEMKMIDKQKADDLIASYDDFATNYPDDNESPEFLFKAGDMAMNLNKPNKAIAFFNRILSEYPNFEKIPQCVFLKAYIYENSLYDLDKAKLIYEEFIKRFPNDEFADDAEVSLKNLGKSPEELIKEFEAKSGE
jgi:outer membrane protein assembly factor BamD (BamD/ComL family)